MSNPHRGHIDLATKGGPVYRLALSINALCELEDATGKNINQIAAMLSEPSKIRLGDVRVLLWAAMRDAHPDATIKDAGEAIGAAGISEAMAALERAWLAAFPAPEGGEPAGTARPTPASKRKAGTG